MTPSFPPPLPITVRQLLLREAAQAAVCVSSFFYQFSACSSELVPLPSTRVGQRPTTLISVTPQTCARSSLATSLCLCLATRHSCLLVSYLFIVRFTSECCCVPERSTEDVCVCMSSIDSYLAILKETVYTGPSGENAVQVTEQSQQSVTFLVCGPWFQLVVVTSS